MDDKTNIDPELSKRMDDTDAEPVAGHDAWFKDQVEKARREAEADPSGMIPHAEARRRLGL